MPIQKDNPDLKKIRFYIANCVSMKKIHLILALFITACTQPESSHQAETPIQEEASDTTRYEEAKNPEFASIRQHYEGLRAEGIVFAASGNEPFWAVRVDHDRKLKFLTPDSTFTTGVEAAESTGNNIHYKSTSGKPAISVHARKESCIDDMSGYPFTHLVKVTFPEGGVFHGCGKVLK